MIEDIRTWIAWSQALWTYVASQHGVVSWLLVVIGILLLLRPPLPWRREQTDSPRHTEASGIAEQPPAQGIKAKPRYTDEDLAERLQKIDDFIGKLTQSLQTLWIGESDPGQESNSVNRYFEWIQKWAWEAIPEYAPSLVPDRGPMTDSERMSYVGWPIKTAALRVMIERQLFNLRRVKAALQGLDSPEIEVQREDSQSI